MWEEISNAYLLVQKCPSTWTRGRKAQTCLLRIQKKSQGFWSDQERMLRQPSGISDDRYLKIKLWGRKSSEQRADGRSGQFFKKQCGKVREKDSGYKGRDWKRKGRKEERGRKYNKFVNDRLVKA